MATKTKKTTVTEGPVEQEVEAVATPTGGMGKIYIQNGAKYLRTVDAQGQTVDVKIP